MWGWIILFLILGLMFPPLLQITGAVLAITIIIAVPTWVAKQLGAK